jgi:A/G-specific adenine glycosylase
VADAFANRLLRWWDEHGRKDLPWQVDRSPYRVWVSEVMLQQTQVATVLPYYARFMARFPDIASLAAAPMDEVLHLWTGLGYYARARNLQRAAATIVAEHGGEFPADYAAVAALPGIGRSTAGAILALSCGARLPMLDGNAERVLARVHAVAGPPKQPATARKLWAYAEKHLPKTRVADYTQALMDLGATVCTRRKPLCVLCPHHAHCLARIRGIETKLPEARPKRELPTRRARLVVVRDGDGVLLELRPTSGLWGGLHSFPELEADADAVAWARVLGLEARFERALPPFKHAFSHFRLEAEPVLLRALAGASRVSERSSVPQGFMWYNLRAPARVGLPKPIARLLTRLTEEEDDAADGPLFSDR